MFYVNFNIYGPGVFSLWISLGRTVTVSFRFCYINFQVFNILSLVRRPKLISFSIKNAIRLFIVYIITMDIESSFHCCFGNDEH